jgi:hypothetical protein
VQLVGFANNPICRSCKENVTTWSQEFRRRESEWPAKNFFPRSSGLAEGLQGSRYGWIAAERLMAELEEAGWPS